MSTQVFPVMVLSALGVVVIFLFVAIWATRYTKCGPNKVLIISGRKIPQPDGTFAGYRIVKGGGTFVFPIIEKLEVLSLEVSTIELGRAKLRTAKGVALMLDGTIQFKINGDNPSIAAAAEQLLGKSEEETKAIVWAVLGKHLSAIGGGSSAEQLNREPVIYADRVQAAASPDLGKMGIGIVSLVIRDVRSA